jgi:hypothetical protein
LPKALLWSSNSELQPSALTRPHPLKHIGELIGAIDCDGVGFVVYEFVQTHGAILLLQFIMGNQTDPSLVLPSNSLSSWRQHGEHV